MFREMRRKKQVLSLEETEAVLERGTSGVLSVSGDDGYPYGVPVSYIYEDGKIYFHCGRSGHKIDAIAGNEKVSFCVIDKDQIVPEEFTTYFRSAVAFGRARIIEDDGAKREAVRKLAVKYCPALSEESIEKAIDNEFPGLCMVEIAIDHLSGKEAIELVRARETK